MAKQMTLEQSSDKFALLIAEGYTLNDAYRLSHPGCKSSNEQSVRTNAWKFSKLPIVAEKIEAERERMRERHREYADTLIDHIEEEVESCWRDNKTLGPVLEQVKLLGRFLGVDKTNNEVVVRNGGVSADYRPPPSIANLDEETLKKIAEGTL